MASAPRPIKRSTHVRCKLCGFVFPGGWFRLPNVPNSAMLLHHLGNDHLAEARPYLKRMETDEIDTVVMELFERLDEPCLTSGIAKPVLHWVGDSHIFMTFLRSYKQR